MTHQRTLSLISVAALLAALAMTAWLPAQVRGATQLQICGTVSAHVPATLLGTGLLTVGGTALVIAPGADVDSDIQAGSSLCLDLALDTSGRITGATAYANVTSSVDVCGIVSAVAAADADSTGSLTIGGQSFVLAAGSNLPASVQAGADLCLALTLNAFGQVSDGAAQANVTSTVRVCGVISAFAAADADSAGSLVIGGQSFSLAAGSSLPAAVQTGADLCTTLTLNAIGQVTDGTAEANIASTVEVSGRVTAHEQATAGSDGRLAIAGVERPIAAGTTLSEQVQVGACVTMRLSLDAMGRIVNGAVLAADGSLTSGCGADAADAPTAGRVGAAAAANAGDGSDGDEGGSLSFLLDLFGTLAAAAGPRAVDDPTEPPSRPAETAPSTGDEPAAPAVAAAAAPAAPGGQGGFLPDTASLARAGAVVAITAVPLLVMLMGLGASMVWRRITGSPGGGEGLIG